VSSEKEEKESVPKSSTEETDKGSLHYPEIRRVINI
jgi:hypothetical protein